MKFGEEHREANEERIFLILIDFFFFDPEMLK